MITHSLSSRWGCSSFLLRRRRGGDFIDAAAAASLHIGNGAGIDIGAVASHSRSSSSSRRRHVLGDYSRRRRVAVTGLGAITPLGPDAERTWTAALRPTAVNATNGEGATSLLEALRRQGLSEDRLELERRATSGLSCQVAAAVPPAWMTTNSDGTGKNGYDDGRTARFVQFALMAADEAVAHAKLDEWLGSGRETDGADEETYRRRRDRTGVSMGNGMSSGRDFSLASSLLYDDPGGKGARRISPHFVPRVLPNSSSARIAIRFALRGPNATDSSACAAGAMALLHAAKAIRDGEADVMVAGGSEAAVDPVAMAGFSRLRALSTGFNQTKPGGDDDDDHDDGVLPPAFDDAPSKASRPFDSRRDGFVLSEGGAVLVLEEWDHAVGRGATILAEVLGVGRSGDGHHVTAPDADGRGAARAMEAALDDARITLKHHAGFDDDNNRNDEEGVGNGLPSSPQSLRVEYVNAHATSTPLGDAAEIRAIRTALRPRLPSSTTSPPPVFVSSTKGATGHLLGAAGALEAALTILAVSRGTLPHTCNLTEVSENVREALSAASGSGSSGEEEGRNDFLSSSGVVLIKDRPLERKVGVAMSNSFGFGGTNVSLVFADPKFVDAGS